MKRLIIPFLLLIIPMIGVSQDKDTPDYKKHSIMITPLGDLLNNSKSSIYYRYVLVDDSKSYFSFRVGTELFNSIDNEYSSGLELKTSSWNIKTGVELGKRIDRMTIYFGPELSFFGSSINRATLFPNENVIFSTNSILVEEWNAIDITTMTITSLIGFVGFKYQLTSTISIGIESGVGIGWYNSKQTYRNSTLVDRHKGFIKDLAVNRFILLEYCF